MLEDTGNIEKLNALFVYLNSKKFYKESEFLRKLARRNL